MDEYRLIVRCRHCQLRQYETHDRNCRRCRKPLYWIAPPPMVTQPRHESQRTWGKVLQQIRHERGLSQRQLGARSGMVRTFVSKLERRDDPPTMATAIRLAGALDVPNYVFTNNDIAYNYYCTSFLFADPLIETITQYLDRLTPEQRTIIADTVRELAEHHQLTFSEWDHIAPMPLGAM